MVRSSGVYDKSSQTCHNIFNSLFWPQCDRLSVPESRKHGVMIHLAGGQASTHSIIDTDGSV